MTTTLDAATTETFSAHAWDERIVPALMDYIRIPCKSPSFDPDWQAHGYMEQAVTLIQSWCARRPIDGLTVDVVRLPGRTPLILMDIPGAGDATVLLYGHLDKQPEMLGWSAGLGPWTPVYQGEKLYGRGGGDDGYAAFCAITAIEALQRQNVPHAHCVVLIEACEESGSPDLPFYVEALAERIGTPDLVVCLDSGCGNYEQLWGTTSLRGLINGELTVEVLSEGVHSGAASGIVPSSFRIIRQLLSRLEDERTGHILPRDFHVTIPAERVAQAYAVAQTLGGAAVGKFPVMPGMRLAHHDLTELLLNGTWRPALSIIGAGGLPAMQDAGNVLRPRTSLKLSLRLPPTADTDRAAQRLKALLEADPPYGARVTFTAEDAGAGWNAPSMAPWLLDSVERASQAYFGKPAMFWGIGGSIPFMAMLGEKFPAAQFFITGLMGPGSNAHGPNEFVHITMGKKLTAAVAQILTDHYQSTYES
jgi:acetylornithine deacetylase/succinyl-diaminopimelate desuccinylase-like protein